MKGYIKTVVSVLAVAAIVLMVLGSIFTGIFVRPIHGVSQEQYMGLAAIFLSGIPIIFLILRFWKKGEGKDVWYFTNWKFWALAIFGLALLSIIYVGFRLGGNLEYFGEGIVGISHYTFMIIASAGPGLFYYVYNIGLPPAITLIFFVVALSYWPLLSAIIGLILTKRPSRRSVVLLSIFVLLMLILGFSRATQLTIESMLNPFIV